MIAYSYEVPEAKTSKTVDLISRTIGSKRVKTKHFKFGAMYVEFSDHTLTVGPDHASEVGGHLVSIYKHGSDDVGREDFMKVVKKLTAYLSQEPDQLDPFSQDN